MLEGCGAGDGDGEGDGEGDGDGCPHPRTQKTLCLSPANPFTLTVSRTWCPWFEWAGIPASAAKRL